MPISLWANSFQGVRQSTFTFHETSPDHQGCSLKGYDDFNLHPVAQCGCCLRCDRKRSGSMLDPLQFFIAAVMSEQTLSSSSLGTPRYLDWTSRVGKEYLSLGLTGQNPWMPRILCHFRDAQARRALGCPDSRQDG